ncbi:hypothetical protein SH528x_003199 [Novipirellula sp. SH528]|uniref:hypothetical protein n=1 Tax=Novipirellula sp. SH528 TaxID=3454466 RepID=UPI003F9EE6CB
MRRFTQLSLLLAFAIICSFAANNSVAVAEDSRNADANQIYPAVYRFYDLPVFTTDGKFYPKLMMQLVRAMTSPSDWEEGGGKSTYTSYPQNLCLIISTHRRNHDKITKLLDEIRSQRENDGSSEHDGPADAPASPR